MTIFNPFVSRRVAPFFREKNGQIEAVLAGDIQSPKLVGRGQTKLEAALALQKALHNMHREHKHLLVKGKP